MGRTRTSTPSACGRHTVRLQPPPLSPVRRALSLLRPRARRRVGADLPSCAFHSILRKKERRASERMCRLSNTLVGFLNLATLLLSIPILAGGIWLSHRASTDCERFLEKPVIVLGVFLLLVSLAGLIGACCGASCLLWLYLFVMFLLILLLFCFTVFAFVVTSKGAGEVVSGRGYKEYRLGDYSNWLQKRVSDSDNWRKIRSCLYDGKVCGGLLPGANTLTVQQFYQENLSPIQSGCCKPPTECGFTYISATEWAPPNDGRTYSNPDCRTWSNEQNALCYDCQSCKAGVLANIKDDWKKVAVVNVIFLIFLIVVYTIGCCAFRNSRTFY